LFVGYIIEREPPHTSKENADLAVFSAFWATANYIRIGTTKIANRRLFMKIP
jgi:hypothetical protein